MLCLITGGAGFIGSHLAEFLLNDGHNVIILDDFSTGSRKNIKAIRSRITLVTGDIRKKGVINAVMNGVDIVFHLAAIPRVPLSVAEPWRTNSVNIDGMLSVLIAARDNGVKRFVFASSSSVYGCENEMPYTEDMKPGPLSPYALHKLTGELYCKQFYNLYGLETVSLRYFNVYGPKQDAGSEYSVVIPKFVEQIKENSSPTIFGDGEQSRAFVHVSDVVAVTKKVALAPTEKVAGKVFNVAGEEKFTIKELASKLISMLGKDSVTPVFLDERAGDLKHSFADMSGLRDAIGFVPGTTLEAGLVTVIDYLAK